MNCKRIKSILGGVLPLRVRKVINQLLQCFLLCEFHLRYRVIIKKLVKNERIKVAFFLIHSSVWKYDELFKLMLADERFNPLVVICPYIVMGDEIMKRDLKLAEEFVKHKEYSYVLTYNEIEKRWIDVKNEIAPDIIFFTNPHYGLTKNEYYITNFTNSLNCYVPYAFMGVDTYDSQFNQAMHNLSWRFFVETDIHKRIAEKHSLAKGRNVIVSGYPGCDIFLQSGYIPSSYPWKISNYNLKRVIWAPHHLINDEGSGLSTFLTYYDIMVEIANKYRDSIQFVFRPHPLLLPKLYKLEEWGEMKSDNYYKLWDEMSNTRYFPDGNYVDLFYTSDALIHDCGSFMTEYLPMNKPVLYLVNSNKVVEGWNEFGNIVFGVHDKAFCKDDIYTFIDNVLLNGNDTYKAKRENVVNDYIKIGSDMNSSQRIFQHIVNTLKG